MHPQITMLSSHAGDLEVEPGC